MGIRIDEETQHSLFFAYDQIIFPQEEYGKWGLYIYFNKSEYLCTGGETEDIGIALYREYRSMNFKYLRPFGNI